MPFKIINAWIITEEFSYFLTTSKRSRIKKESDRGKDFYKSTFQKLSTVENKHHYTRFFYKGSSIVERIIRTKRNSIKKPVFEKRNAIWIAEQSTVNIK